MKTTIFRFSLPEVLDEGFFSLFNGKRLMGEETTPAVFNQPKEHK